METVMTIFAGVGVITTVFVICFFLAWALTALIERRQNSGKWYPASNAPSTQRDVVIFLRGEKRRGWRGFCGNWYVYPPDSREVFDCIECNPTQWRELKDGE